MKEQWRKMQLDIFGKHPDILAIERIRQFEPPEGYWLAFSGGKDSVCLLDLVKRSGVKYDAHYNVTTCDPPEVIRFISRNFPEVIWEKPKESIFKAIVRNGFPTRTARWCCRVFKENQGRGRVILVGNRAEESVNRKRRGMVNRCYKMNTTSIAPLIDWSSEDVWNYIREQNLNYCSLYDEGWKRIGCTICPFNSKAETRRAMERWPRIFKCLKRAFERLYDNRESCQRRWPDAQAMYDWWLARDLPYPSPNDDEREEIGLFDY